MIDFHLGGSHNHSNSTVVIVNQKGQLGGLLPDWAKESRAEEQLFGDKGQDLAVIASGDTYIAAIKADSETKHYWWRLEKIRKAASKAYDTIAELGHENLQLVDKTEDKKNTIAFIEGFGLSSYQFLKYFSEADKKKSSVNSLSITESNLEQRDLNMLIAAQAGVEKARTLVNEPNIFMTAPQMAKEFQSMSGEVGISIDVWDKAKIQSENMGGLLAVNMGSIEEPRLSIMEYKPENPVNSKPYVLVGKGVVYDTGGMSLKPTKDSMDFMKSDMGGAAAVSGAIYAIAKAKLNVHVIAIVPSTDNRPDGNAYVPGDVIKMHNGMTVEVLNTDAEGRMILADALSLAKNYDAPLVIDVATLTGAAAAAVGKQAVVAVGNADEGEMNLLKEAGYDVFERIAEMPFWDDYSELLKSDIADMKNIGGPYAGSITAGKFLEKFTDYPYIHIDIAGSAFNKQKDSYRGTGGTGVGVRLLFDFFRRKAEAGN
ncbi:MAG: hypothetical protein Kapaf2KO_20960 [Candidatus Kapaibacteriales bacterium]